MDIGIVGTGQLGRMLALSAIPLGARVRFAGNTGSTATADIRAARYGELESPQEIAEFAAGTTAMTYETESAPPAMIRALERRGTMYPSSRALEISGDRQLEKEFLNSLGIPTAKHAAVSTAAELARSVARLGGDVVAKTRRMGYDGKGQAWLSAASDAPAVWKKLGGEPLVVEQRVPFDRELSLIVVAGRDRQLAYYPLTENVHRQGILRLSVAPAADRGGRLQRQAEHHAAKIVKALDYRGVLAIEWFDCGGELVANEMAPRVHNSGHWTLDGALTSQFENHIRAICGLPLGSTAALGRTTMVNLIGHIPPLQNLPTLPGVRLHLYNKTPAPGRKLGHVNITETLGGRYEATVDKVCRWAASEPQESWWLAQRLQPA